MRRGKLRIINRFIFWLKLEGSGELGCIGTLLRFGVDMRV